MKKAKLRGSAEALRRFLDSLEVGGIKRLASRAELPESYLPRLASGDRPITLDVGIRLVLEAERGLSFRRLFPEAPFDVVPIKAFTERENGVR